MEASFDDPYLLFVEKKISNIRDLVPVLEKIMQTGRPLVIIAEDVEGEALATLVVNKIRGTFKSPPSRPRASATAARRCCRTWPPSPAAQVISEDLGLKLENVTLDLLGEAKRVVITKDDTTIVDGAGVRSPTSAAASTRSAEIENTDSDYDREKLQERLAKLAGGVAVIKVGAATEVELKEKKHRVEDALHATRAASEEGIVPGGGVGPDPLPERARQELETSDERQVGVRIIKRSIEEPLRQIAANAGVEGSVVVDKVRSSKGNHGFNAATNEYGDLVKPPASSTRPRSSARRSRTRRPSRV
jgi:chaperonin GroEL